MSMGSITSPTKRSRTARSRRSKQPWRHIADRGYRTIPTRGGPSSPGERVRTLHVGLLRRAERWDALLQHEPADEHAHLALMRASATRGDLRGAVRQYER